MKSPNKSALIMASTLAFAAPGLARDPAPQQYRANDPAADYPVVLGQPFTIDGITYTPADSVNYDSIGYAQVSGAGGSSITAAHRTLPLPSYIEVTSLATGKTILVRVERRGPMQGNSLLDLSPGAAMQLGIAEQGYGPVRVRRVNPPEADRVLLRAGQAAPDRMETPKGLRDVLMRKLDGSFKPATSLHADVPGPAATATVPPVELAPKPVKPALQRPKPPVKPVSKPLPAPPPEPMPMPEEQGMAEPLPMPEQAAPQAVAPQAVAQRPMGAGALVVQLAAFSDRARAFALARRAGADVVTAGRIYRVQIGPFNSQEEAADGLAEARAAGYTASRILRADR